MVLSAQLGIHAKYVYLRPFGYINITQNLVGIGPCNNPFYEMCKVPPTHPDYEPWFQTISNEKIWTTSQHPKKQSSFGNHAFVKYSGKIYDACAGPDVGTRTPPEYLEHSIDIETSMSKGFYGSTPATAAQIIAWLASIIKSGISIRVKKCD